MESELLLKGYPPSVREICRAVHLSSTSSVHAHLNSLEKNGYIRRDPTKPRAIEIIDDSFYARDYNENRILGYAVLHSTLACDGKVIYSYITREKMQEFGVTTKELEGIVPQLRLTRGVICAFFLYQTGDCQYKVSFRTSEAMDANAIASIFEGGGHARAAGCTVCGELAACMEGILTEVAKAL